MLLVEFSTPNRTKVAAICRVTFIFLVYCYVLLGFVNKLSFNSWSLPKTRCNYAELIVIFTTFVLSVRLHARAKNHDFVAYPVEFTLNIPVLFSL